MRRKLLKARKLYLIINVAPGQRLPLASINNLVRGKGIDIIQLRYKRAMFSRFLKYAISLRRMCNDFGILFIINDRADIALACGADGLHIGQDDIMPYMARRILGDDKIIGLSTHSQTQIREASVLKDVDYIGVGPVFKTAMKPHAKPVGLKLIKYISSLKYNRPFFPIGGINIENVMKIAKAGAERAAVSRGILDSTNPLKAIRVLREALS
ncbi:MAG: thiamine phosphate synthase [Candidatus Omnitrophota bacterium]